MRPDIGAFLIAVFFISGASLSAFNIGWKIIPIGFIVAAAVYIVGRKSINIILSFAAILFVIFTAGSFYFHLRHSNPYFSSGSLVSGQAVISSFPERRTGYQRFSAILAAPLKGSVDFMAPLYPSFRYGDLLEFSGKVEYGNSGKPIIAFPTIGRIKSGEGNFIVSRLFGIRERMTDIIMMSLPPSSSALAAGILLGDQSGFSKEMWDSFRDTGTTHIVALSGFNIAVIASVAGAAASVFSHRAKFLFPATVIVLFVVMAGGEASAVRAAIMGTVILFGRDIGRPASMRNVIAFAAIIMVIWDPGVVVFDIGFELSFMAVIGIIYLAPLVRKVFGSGENKLNSFSNIVIDTASAQAVVTPLLLMRFGFVSWYSLPVNLLVVGTVPLAMALSFAVAISGLFSKSLCLIAAIPADIVLQYELKTISIFTDIF